MAVTSPSPEPTSVPGDADAPLLRIDGLSIEFRTERGWLRVVDDMQLTVPRRQTVGLVGESGSGKTVTSLAVLRLHDRRNARVTGSIRFDGRELLELSEQDMARVRGAEIGMIFQEPRRSLNPAFTVGAQIAEGLRRHRGLSRRAATARAVEMLDRVGIAGAHRRVRHYPHEFSGGMCQRVMLAVALSCEPKLLIADEPTTALDTTVQAQVLRLIDDLQDQFGVSVLFITHDLGVVAEMCDVVAVMYAGQLVEVSGLYDLFGRPLHPYTQGLLESVPDAQLRSGWLRSIPGVVPPPWILPQGCRFHPRCPHAQSGRCDASAVPLFDAGDGRLSRCVRIEELRPEVTAP